MLTITTAEPVDALRVRAFNHDMSAFRLAPDTWRVLVGIDLDVAPGTHIVSIEAPLAAPKIASTYPLRVRAKLFPTRSLSVDEAFVNPPAGVEARIQEEAAELARIWKSSAAQRLWDAPFVRPVPDAANSRFGTRSVFNGQPRSPHGGADFPESVGHADPRAQRGTRRARPRSVFLRKHHRHRSRAGALLDAGASVRDRRARGRHGDGRAGGRPRWRDGTRHRARICTGRCAPPTRASIRSRCSRCWGNHNNDEELDPHQHA